MGADVTTADERHFVDNEYKGNKPLVDSALVEKNFCLKDAVQAEVEAEQEEVKSDSDDTSLAVFSCRDYLNIKHKKTVPLIGTERDALLVPGECLMVPGTGGVGKTLFVTSMAANMALGENVLKWQLSKPLKVLLVQAELPPQFFQQRISVLIEAYEIADASRASTLKDNIFIADVNRAFDIASKEDTASQILGEIVETYAIDIVIIDPFLSFFSGNENDNNEVRRALDNLKRGVAERYGCGLIITDHQPKYSNSDKNKEQQNSMRGAGAKRDFAASVIALNSTKTPAGQHGTFIKATIDKMRYGKVPREPFVIKRDGYSFRHFVYKGNDIELHDIAKALDDAGSGLSSRAIQSLITKEFSLSDHDARNKIKEAVDEGLIVTAPGKRNALIHDLGGKYVQLRNQSSVSKTSVSADTVTHVDTL